MKTIEAPKHPKPLTLRQEIARMKATLRDRQNQHVQKRIKDQSEFGGLTVYDLRSILRDVDSLDINHNGETVFNAGKPYERTETKI